ncbi:3-oxoacyl-ACP reductase FabG [Kushneria phosphatilytica]|uniref:3-oxoacyl-ACP reductase FabG n=1 Tax=Kushneria phosphatilytica TaxID=657387 RepID=A0A1S1NYS9_9GAMM|nr:3-oxoacyl-ACP reductase FabG [Kushneria phosphatilytica]OHV10545.1 3-oxoacyl-ACP reductase [Kushneria phosphatilytica]QEL11884.1 3-oxoacyl-ACP reductase FabG [Kushneria phosphatilytica]
MSDDDHRCILVTGAGRGIGRAIALRLARDGFDIAVHYHSSREAAEGVAEEIRGLGRQARLMCFDLADRSAARAAIEADIAEYGACHGVVLSAGYHSDAPLPGMSDEQWDRVMDVNLDGFYNVLRPMIMAMIQRRRGGRIITLSSAAGELGNRGQVNYSAAKGGLIAATRALSVELAKRNITVNCVAPGWIESDMTAAIDRESIKQTVPMQRPGQADEVAGTVSFLCSDDASYITRQVIAVNGGLY